MGTQSITFRSVLTGQYLTKYSDHQPFPEENGRGRGRDVGRSLNRSRQLWVWAIHEVIDEVKAARIFNTSVLPRKREERARTEKMNALRQTATSPREEELYMDVHEGKRFDSPEGERLDGFDEGDESVGPLGLEPTAHFYPSSNLTDFSHGFGEERWSADGGTSNDAEDPDANPTDANPADTNPVQGLDDDQDDQELANEMANNKRFQVQLKLCNDSKGAGFGDMDRTAFGLVALDDTAGDFIENNG